MLGLSKGNKDVPTHLHREFGHDWVLRHAEQVIPSLSSKRPVSSISHRSTPYCLSYMYELGGISETPLVFAQRSRRAWTYACQNRSYIIREVMGLEMRERTTDQQMPNG